MFDTAFRDSLKALIIQQMEIEFGPSDLPANLEKFANAMATAIAIQFYVPAGP
jgi:hypothetical protein